MPREYLARAGTDAAVKRQRVPAGDLPFEFMLNALRLTDGFALPDFEAATGLPVTTVEDTLEQLVARDLLERVAPRRYRPTRRGLGFLNDLQLAFLPAPDRRRPEPA